MPTLVSERARIAATCRYDPLLFAEWSWPWGEGKLKGKDIRAWQSIVLDRVASHLGNPETRFNPLRIAVSSGHGIGKSALAGMLATWALATFVDPRIVITANTETQLVTKTSPEVGQWVRSSMFADLFDVETMSIKYRTRPEQHRLDFLTNNEQKPEAFAGLHAAGRIVLIIMDEASAIPDVIWNTIQGALTDENTILIWVAMGNPTSASGEFRECFRYNAKFWTTYQIDSRTVEGTNKAALQEIIDKNGKDSDEAKVRVYGQFPSISGKQFFPTAYVDAAYGRHLREEEYAFAPKIIALDPAWDGGDELVFGMRQGLKYEILDTVPKNDNDWFIATKLAFLETQNEADAVFIDAGYGTGIYSAGQQMGREWRLVWFGEAAVDPGCFNKRAEMHRDTRNWLLAGGSIPPDPRLYQEMTAINTKPHADGKVQVESKPELKRRIPNFGSPNRTDALVMTFAYPVERKMKHSGGDHPSRYTVKPLILNETFNPHED